MNEYPPFLSRDQLKFQEATNFAINIKSVACAAGTISIRGFTKEGQFNLVHTPNSDKSAKTETFYLPDAPIMLTIDDEAKSFTKGECFVRATLLLNKTSVYQLISGYVYGFHGLTYPTTNQEESLLESGKLTTIVSADPAAGAEITITVPAGEEWKLIGAKMTLVNDANVANRYVALFATIDSVQMPITLHTTPLTAGLTYPLSFRSGIGAGPLSNNTYFIAPLSENIILPAGSVLATITSSIQVGDNFGPMTVLIEKRVIENV